MLNCLVCKQTFEILPLIGFCTNCGGDLVKNITSKGEKSEGQIDKLIGKKGTSLVVKPYFDDLKEKKGVKFDIDAEVKEDDSKTHFIKSVKESEKLEDFDEIIETQTVLNDQGETDEKLEEELEVDFKNDSAQSIKDLTIEEGETYQKPEEKIMIQIESGNSKKNNKHVHDLSLVESSQKDDSDKKKKKESSKNWLSWVVYFYALFGLFALIISGYIEFLFFTGIFSDFLIPSILLAITFEGVKIGTIILGRFFDISKSENVSRTVKLLNYITRTFLIIFSVVCSFAKIAEFMDSPNYIDVWNEERNRIEEEYNETIIREDSVLQLQIAKHLEDLKAERLITSSTGDYVGPNYIAKKTLYEEAVERKENRLDELRRNKSRVIKERQQEITSDKRVKNQILVGFHTTILNSGIQINFQRFYSFFVLLISFFVTTILELIIMTVFNYMTIVKFKAIERNIIEPLKINN